MADPKHVVAWAVGITNEGAITLALQNHTAGTQFGVLMDYIEADVLASHLQSLVEYARDTYFTGAKPAQPQDESFTRYSGESPTA